MKHLLARYQKTAIVGFQLLVVLAPSLVFAGPIPAPSPIESVDDLKTKVFCVATDWLFTLSVILSTIFVLYAAFLYVTAAGDEKKVSQARATITYAAIGVAVAILAAGVPQVIGSLLGENGVANPCASGGGGGWPGQINT